MRVQIPRLARRANGELDRYSEATLAEHLVRCLVCRAAEARFDRPSGRSRRCSGSRRPRSGRRRTRPSRRSRPRWKSRRTAQPIEAEEPDPIEAEEPDPIEAEAPDPIEAEAPEPIEAEEPEPIEADVPAPIEAEEPVEPEDTFEPEPELEPEPDQPRRGLGAAGRGPGERRGGQLPAGHLRPVAAVRRRHQGAGRDAARRRGRRRPDCAAVVERGRQPDPRSLPPASASIR